MKRISLSIAIAAVGIVALAAVPLFASGYHLALGISMLDYAVLATAWALFSGPTRYISLATSAFFGIGAYTVAVLADAVTLPLALAWPLMLAAAAMIGTAVALVVGASTLRLSGAYFVIFTFGLSELIRQLVTWYEANIHRSVGRYVFLNVTQAAIYWQLLALAVLVFAAGWLLRRSRYGLALKVIGDDEAAARHCGIDTTRVKPLISFQVVIMALFGGPGRLAGPLLGVVPLVLLFEFLTTNFPNHFSILLGLAFIAIVYVLPNGVAGLIAAPRKAAA